MDYFEDYVKKYDLSNNRLYYKYNHSKRVMDNMEMIAKSIHLSDYDVYLAKVIGLFHDIGRFEQYTLYQSFDDKYLNHAIYGKELLEKNKVLDTLNIKKEDYNVVYQAILNHNRYQIDSNLSERELLFSKMIRDADKLDILYALGNKKIKPVFYEDDSEITSEVSQAFFTEKPIMIKIEKTSNDRIITLLAFIYDINFDITIDNIEKHKYYEKIFHRLKHKNQYKQYIKYIKKYLKERKKKIC